MSAIRKNEDLLTPEDYIAGELRSEIRHEYLAGRVYARACSSVEHNHIAGNFLGELGIHLRGKKCAPFATDMKVRVRNADTERFYYPDVMVNCDPAGQQRYFCDTPALIVEVLSPDTQGTDRREKLLAYQGIPSLHTYILAEQEQREITVWRGSRRAGKRRSSPVPRRCMCRSWNSASRSMPSTRAPGCSSV